MGDKELIGLVGLIFFFFLLVLKARVAFAMAFTGIVGTFVLSIYVPYIRFEPYIMQYKSLLWENLANYELSVIPLFIFMGYLASHTKLAQALFIGMNAIFGRFRGGVAITAIGACAGFGAVSGSSLATASTMGKIALPELEKLNYSPRLATGTLAAGGTLGILIPPSIALILYAIVVEGSIIEMFQAAILPGLLAVLFFIMVIIIQVRIKPELGPASEPLSKEERNKAFLGLIPVVLTFGSIILGLGLGLFTPTPAAAAGVFIIAMYGLYQRIRYGKGEGLTFKRLKDSLVETAVSSAMIYYILFGAEVLKGFFTRSGLPQAIAEWAMTVDVNPWMVLIGILIIFIILGFFMDSMAMILVIIPFIWPVLVSINGGEYVTAATAGFGMNNEDLKIWFGILALISVELGLITPPVGLNVFIISKISEKVPMIEIFKGVIPFVGAEIIRIGVLLFLPWLSLFMPHWLAGN
ncbi:TRAP transporter, large permease subunit [Arcobacter venerupis]|uniref:TRAP transporter, large permease subunit n=1 Tax=Arcobacter venerupis TaxID=1054033 RepID=A0AAE7E3X2_9BACT|nr:TRAP transporter large permease [Arcobacter venerupis]QKF67688.1 TRAP transporter, large permease subunit [Arcobacter venerupis]RWS49156.1 C4-dicarboxylate ABC transporter permease [Arcobacter venerupis]